MALQSGYLRKYFKGIIAKRLSVVEVMPKKSNQHEYNATSGMKEIFGLADRKFETDFLYIDDENSVTDKNFLTWYDARRNHPTRSEYRLYYPSTKVSEMAKAGDSLFICVRQDNTILCIIADEKSTITSQLYWLFDLNVDEEQNGKFTQNTALSTDSGRLEFLVRIILEQIGIVYEEYDDDGLTDKLIGEFGNSFPKTSLFSAFARSLVKDIDPVKEPDAALLQWFGMEEKLFFLMEKNIVKERLSQGFVKNGQPDVEMFIAYSLSVQNRRKSRAGYSLENHICAILDYNGIVYSHTPVTENRSKPDFLFPNIECYRDGNFLSQNLTMLGVKSSCKDRWRQVLAEAERIDRKHLLTLESPISTYQTDEMQNKHLQLVVPEPMHAAFKDSQRKWIYSLADFLGEIKEKQRRTKYASMLIV